MPINAAPLPRIHLAQTLDYIESESRLYTTYGSLTSQAMASKIVLNDASLVLHQVAKQQRLIGALSSVIETDYDELKQLRDAMTNTRQLTERLTQSLADSVAKIAVMLEYNRRWSLVHGAQRETKGGSL